MTSGQPIPASDRTFDRVAWLMDRSLHVPGTRISIGLDALLELVPGLGDAAATLVQGVLVLAIAARNPTLPRAFITRMVVNIILDCVVGSIPIVGDIFDAFFKANTRNVKLLQAARAEQAARGQVASTGHVFYLVGLAVLMIAIAGATGFAAVWIIRTGIGWLHQFNRFY